MNRISLVEKQLFGFDKFGFLHLLFFNYVLAAQLILHLLQAVVVESDPC